MSIREVPRQRHRLYALRLEPFCELEVWLADYQRLSEDRLDRFGVALEDR